MKGFWNDFISVNEMKQSSIVLIFIPTSIFALVMYWFDRDITDNLLTWLITLGTIIGGVNGVNLIADMIGKSRNKKQDDINSGM
jgi:dolichyl-phosphate-mannose--protein O-mannosyl transferase